MLIKIADVLGMRVNVNGENAVQDVDGVVFDQNEKLIKALVIGIDEDEARAFGLSKTRITRDEIKVDEEAIKPAKEVVQKDESNILKQTQLFDRNGQALGLVTDVMFEPKSGKVERLIVHYRHPENHKPKMMELPVEVVSVWRGQRADLTPEGIKAFYKQIPGENQQKEAKAQQNQESKAVDKLKKKSEERSQEAQHWFEKAADKVASGVEKVQEKVSGDDEVVGEYLTKNILDDDDRIIGKRGELVTNQMWEEAQNSGVEERLSKHTSKQPVAE